MNAAASRLPRSSRSHGGQTVVKAHLRRHGGAWCAAAVLVSLGWLLTPHPIPLYDGVGLPDEPYRFVSAPAGAKVTPLPTGGTISMAVTAGTTKDFQFVATGESGPQATAGFPEGTLKVSAGPVAVRLAPLAPTEQPSGTTIDGNVYELDVTSPSGPVRFTAGSSPATLYLRAAAQGDVDLVFYRVGAGQPWKPLTTSQVGGDIWGAVPPGPGQFALARDPAGSGDAVAGPTSSVGFFNGSSLPLGAIVLAAVVVALLAVVLVVRRRAAHLDE
ncbi:MAG: hypothetical protein H7323_02325 [Frankiales bacterium]|nr:hypothetical protein [Frankiales bacterium]